MGKGRFSYQNGSRNVKFNKPYGRFILTLPSPSRDLQHGTTAKVVRNPAMRGWDSASLAYEGGGCLAG